jgi:hypothetical protein
MAGEMAIRFVFVYARSKGNDANTKLEELHNFLGCLGEGEEQIFA